MKKVFSENKVLFLLATIIIVCLVVTGVALVGYFYGGNGEDVYGTRLDGIEEYQLDTDIQEKVSNILKENEAFNKAELNVKGKVIYINIDLQKNLSLVDGQSLALKSLEAFNDEIKGFYDIQIIVTAESLEEESSLYPYMGYKNAKGSKVVWTNNK